MSTHSHDEHAAHHAHDGHEAHAGHSHAAAHAHGHSHGRAHAHAHTPADFGRAFAIGTGLNVTFVVFEFGYGWFANSLALIADAGHNLGDVLGLLLAWFAAGLTRRPATTRHSYGFRRSPVLAALANASLMLLGAGAIGWEAMQRLHGANAVDASPMIWVAAVGVLINGATALMFMAGRKDDLNIRGAFLHMATDAAVSGGVVLAGVIILFTSWFWVDPAISLVLAAAIAYGAWGLLREAMNLALDAVPEGIELETVQQYLQSVEGVADAHHLHIWGLSTSEAALTVHLVLREGIQSNALLQGVHETLRVRFKIGHATIQAEFDNGEACVTAR